MLPSPEAEYLSSTLNGIENPDVAVSHWTTKVGSAEERPEGQSSRTCWRQTYVDYRENLDIERNHHRRITITAIIVLMTIISILMVIL